MAQENELPDRWPHSCGWCRGPLVQTGRGRPRRYCRAGCRQRAYEQRRVVKAADAVTEWLAWTRWRLESVETDVAELLDQLGPVPSAKKAAADARASLHRRIADLGKPSGRRRFPPRNPLPTFPNRSEYYIPAPRRIKNTIP